VILEIKGSEAVLKTRPTPSAMALAKTLEGRRRWLSGGGLVIEATGRNIELLRYAYPHLEVIKTDNSASEEDLEFAPARPPYTPKTKHLPHQEEALKRIGDKPYFGLFCEQGTGKSKITIDRCGELWSRGKITGALVITKKGVHRQWADHQIPTHSGNPSYAQFWPLKKFPTELMPGEELKWFTINIDGIKTKAGMAMCQEFLKAHKNRIMVIIDESQIIKNVRSQRWKAAQIIGERVPYRMIMTGTPIAKDLTDEWSQLKWLDENILGIRYAKSFMNEYCIMGGFEGRVVIGHRNIDRFREKTAPFTFRVTKEDIGLMPPTWTPWNFDMSKEQRDTIRELKKNLIAEIESGEIVSAANAAVKFLRMQQVSNGWFNNEDGKPVRMFENVLDNPRIIALTEFLESHDGKAVIWARFREDIAQIEEALSSSYSVVSYHGGTSNADRKAAIDSFNDPDGARYFISNPAAGGTGLNLQEQCSLDVFYSNSDNAIERWQAEARIDRIGTTGVVSHNDLIAVGGVDRAILSRNAKKSALSQMALGDIRKMLEDEL